MRLLLALLLLCLGTSASAKEPLRVIEGVVTKVSDGDTIQVTDHLGTRIKVRLYGIDAPETAKGKLPGQPYGEASHQALTRKTLSQRVRLDVLDIDKYRRLVSLVWIGSRTINREMVAEGHAWAFRKYLDLFQQF
jgi:endonuclease YncB( thermonuclease family)